MPGFLRGYLLIASFVLVKWRIVVRGDQENKDLQENKEQEIKDQENKDQKAEQ